MELLIARMMKSLSNMIECDYSFDMLYKAAFGTELPLKEKKKFKKLDQDSINRLVEVWAQKAGWVTHLKSDQLGREFLAFHPQEQLKHQF